MQKVERIYDPAKAIQVINGLIKPYLDSTFSSSDLERVLSRINGSADVDYNSVVRPFTSMAILADKLSFSKEDFILIFGNDLYELLVESRVSIGGVGERRFAAMQLHHRTDGQLFEAHQVLCSRGARLEHVLTSGRDLSMPGARTHTLLFSVELS